MLPLQQPINAYYQKQNQNWHDKGSDVLGCGTYNNCVGLSIHVYDGHEKLIYIIESSLCQMDTVCCCLRCCVGQMIDYTIYDATGKTIGRIANIHNGCLKELFTKQDKFGL
jgi:hypothetical protein